MRSTLSNQKLLAALKRVVAGSSEKFKDLLDKDIFEILCRWLEGEAYEDSIVKKIIDYRPDPEVLKKIQNRHLRE